MANYTATDDVSWDRAAYDRYAYFAYRAENYFDQFVDVKPTNQSMPGTSVVFLKVADLAVASTALNESTDVTPQVMSDSNVTVTLSEYGSAVVTTALLRATSYVPVDPIVANAVGYNAGVSIDTVAREVFYGGSNVRYAATTEAGTAAAGRTTLTPSNKLFGADVRRAVAELRAANVPTFDGGFYAGIMHPDVSYDFRGATGGTNWRDPHTYSGPEGIWRGEIGAFEGVRFLEAPRAKVWADAGSSTTLTDVYGTLIFGRQAVAKAFSSMFGPGPQVMKGPVTDILRRFVPIGWYALLGYGRFREEAMRRIESASSIGGNT